MDIMQLYHFSPPKENIIEMKLQRGKFENILNLLNSSTEKINSKIEIIGELVGIDLDTRSFHLKNLEEDIRGILAGDFIIQPILVQKKYKATIVKEIEIKYSTDYEDQKYYLSSLEPIE
jgi:hypothetical protein